MKRIALLLLIAVLAGCAPQNQLVKKEIQLVETPIPFCPAPPPINLTKDTSVESITETTPPGDVAKLWYYEATYWKSLAEIQRVILETYKQSAVDLEKLKQELSKMIDTTNVKLKETAPPAP